MTFGLPQTTRDGRVQVFLGMNNDGATGGITQGGWQNWKKPVNCSMCHIFALGPGGEGGTGTVGANSSAGGGGGGGSGGQTIIQVPLMALPEQLYILVGSPGIVGFISTDTVVSIQPATAAVMPINHVLLIAKAGNKGGPGSGSGGGGGTSIAAATAGDMALGWPFLVSALAGQAGIAGGSAVSGGALTLPTTGLHATGGTGGGGLPAAAATGTNGGSFTVPAAPPTFLAHAGGQGSATATDPAAPGTNGYQMTGAGLYFYGGTGGASTHGSATGGGLVGSQGGQGGIGSGGGGGGGALTTSTQGKGGRGGSGIVIITCW